MILGIFLAVGMGLIAYYSDSAPKEVPTASADEIAKKMLVKMNVAAWDTLQNVSWKSNGASFAWHKPSNFLVMTWDNTKVELDLNTIEGKVYKDGKQVEDKSAINRAWTQWCNDSFWMFAHYKVFDKGTSRSLIPVEEGKVGLMVSYTGGGVTPGDKYLWILNKDLVPEGFKMWVKIIPIGGTYASWENWTQLASGIMVAPKHKLKVYDFEFTDIK